MESSIFTADADEWKFVRQVPSCLNHAERLMIARQHRNIARPFFTKDRITDFDCFERHTADLIDVLKMKSQKGQAVDFQVRL